MAGDISKQVNTTEPLDMLKQAILVIFISSVHNSISQTCLKTFACFLRLTFPE